MRLKKLTLSGFKSFADKTTLNFDSGITCIVGPNGCGKSNISDAFRWVLGEQSAKSMRGNKMPDVIFSGTTQRKPVNVAEVSLTFSGVRGVLPVEYDEITVTRRLHRDGDSEYLLNGRNVRLKDIQGLFLDSGVGSQAFSIFEQGKMDEIIRFSPLERRSIFEEAAGIVRFLQRKRESIKRLELVDQNLERALDIQNEVEKQIQVLEQQAQEAKKFTENKNRLESLEKNLLTAKWKLLNEKGAKGKETESNQEKELKVLTNECSEIQKISLKIRLELGEAQKNTQSKREELFKLESRLDMGARDNEIDEGRLKELHDKEKKLKHDLEHLHKLKGPHTEALNKIRFELNEAESRLADLGETILPELVKAKEADLAEKQKKLQLLQQQRMQLMQKESRLESECKQLEIRVDSQDERTSRNEERKSLLDHDKEAFKKSIIEKEALLKRHSDISEGHQQHLLNLDQEISNLKREIEKLQSQKMAMINRRMEQEARQKALKRMRDDHEGFSSSSKKLLKESEDPKSPLFGKLAPLFESFIHSGHTPKSLAVKLKNYTHTLVVKTLSDFNLTLHKAKEMGLSDFSLWCQESLLDSIENHFLSNFQETENHTEALNLINETEGDIWSHEGALIDNKKVFFAFGINEQHPFLREAEITGLEKEIQKMLDSEKELNERIEQLAQQRERFQTERQSRDKMLREEELKKVEIRSTLQRAINDMQRSDTELQKIAKEIELLQGQSSQYRAQLKAHSEELKSVKESLISLHNETEMSEKTLSEQMQVLKFQQKDLREWETSRQRFKEDQQRFLHQISLLELKEQERNKNELRIETELSEQEQSLEQIRKRIQEREPLLQTLRETRTEQKKQANELQEKTAELNVRSEEKESEQMRLQNLIKKKEEALHQSQLQIMQIKASIENLENDLKDRYQLTIEEALNHFSSNALSVEKMEKEIRALKQIIQESPAINMASIEELEGSKERYGSLHIQMEDLVHSKEEILAIISQLDGESRKMFNETFQIVRKNFQKNFQILFQGGEADLLFTEEGQILEAGIEIVAKPPGKQMKSMSLLSGGEKCLTAVALLFAIFEVKPSPFCILDEIDAPLDEANVERFVNVVKHFADRCQFLIITHNKRTMAIGDVLCGVSMEEKGVSKLLSLEFSKLEEGVAEVRV